MDDFCHMGPISLSFDVIYKTTLILFCFMTLNNYNAKLSGTNIQAQSGQWGPQGTNGNILLLFWEEEIIR